MGLQVYVLNPLRGPSAGDDRRCAANGSVDVPGAAVQFGHQIARRIRDPSRRILVAVDLRRIGGERGLRIEHCGQHVVLDDEGATPLLGCCHRFCYHDRHPLADEAHNGIENVGVVRIVDAAVVAGGREGGCRAVFRGQDQMHARYLLGRGCVDGDDPGMCVRTSENTGVQQPGRGVVECVGLGSGDDPRTGGCCEGPSTRRTVDGLLGVDHPADGVGHGAIPGAATQVSLQPFGKLVQVFLAQRRGGDDHSRSAESTLESGGFDEPALHRMQIVRCTETRDGGDGPVGRTEGGEDARMHRFAVDENRTCAAVARVAPLLHLEVVVFTEHGAQTLTGPWSDVGRHTVDVHDHDNSSRIWCAAVQLM